MKYVLVIIAAVVGVLAASVALVIASGYGLNAWHDWYVKRGTPHIVTRYCEDGTCQTWETKGGVCLFESHATFCDKEGNITAAYGQITVKEIAK